MFWDIFFHNGQYSAACVILSDFDSITQYAYNVVLTSKRCHRDAVNVVLTFRWRCVCTGHVYQTNTKYQQFQFPYQYLSKNIYIKGIETRFWSFTQILEISLKRLLVVCCIKEMRIKISYISRSNSSKSSSASKHNIPVSKFFGYYI